MTHNAGGPLAKTVRFIDLNTAREAADQVARSGSHAEAAVIRAAIDRVAEPAHYLKHLITQALREGEYDPTTGHTVFDFDAAEVVA